MRLALSLYGANDLPVNFYSVLHFLQHANLYGLASLCFNIFILRHHSLCIFTNARRLMPTVTISFGLEKLFLSTKFSELLQNNFFLFNFNNVLEFTVTTNNSMLFLGALKVY